jgi:hypothetical protein
LLEDPTGASVVMALQRHHALLEQVRRFGGRADW